MEKPGGLLPPTIGSRPKSRNASPKSNYVNHKKMEAIGGVLLTTSSTCSRQLSGTLRWPKAISDYAAPAKSASRGRTRHHVDRAFRSHSPVASQHLDPRPVDIPSVIGDAEKILNQASRSRSPARLLNASLQSSVARIWPRYGLPPAAISAALAVHHRPDRSGSEPAGSVPCVPLASAPSCSS